MQGTYRNNGLPRPYYMKPSSRKKSPYDSINQSVNFFNSSRRKVLGYLVLLFLIGTCLLWVGQDLKPHPVPTYELVKDTSPGKVPNADAKNNDKLLNVDKIGNPAGSKKDKGISIEDLAGNLAQGSKGEKGLGVAEAPKGGVANEASLVGTDPEGLVGGKKANPNANANANANAIPGPDAKKVPGGGPPYDTSPPTKGYKADKAVEDTKVSAKGPAANKHLEESVKKIVDSSENS